MPEDVVEQTAATVIGVVTASVVTGVGVAVISAVASSIASATATATAGAAASAAAGGAAAGAAGGASGSAGGGGAVMPLIFGAQRFGANGGLAVEKSEFQSGVADSISTGPLSGNLLSISFWLDGGEANATADSRGSTTDPPGRRLTARRQGRSEGMEAMVGTFVNAGIVCGTVLGLTVLVGVYWKHRINHKFYRQKKAKGLLGMNDLKDKKQTTFIGLPGLFVFPSAFVCAHPRRTHLTAGTATSCILTLTARFVVRSADTLRQLLCHRCSHQFR